MCIKGESNAKCRFCQGICICSRCIRSITISKLKTIFSLLGGDILELQRQSYFSKMCSRACQELKDSIKSDSGKKEVKEVTLASYKMQL
jgi:hypothetical protein